VVLVDAIHVKIREAAVEVPAHRCPLQDWVRLSCGVRAAITSAAEFGGHFSTVADNDVARTRDRARSPP
jgi:hypothetical protein